MGLGLSRRHWRSKMNASIPGAGEMGYPPAKCALGQMLFADPTQAERGLALCREAAEAGDAEAQAKVGDFYLRGSGQVKADHAEARGWYDKAAQQKQPAAARQLGEMYAKGDGGKR